jgi:hypothetical protein
MTLAQSTHSKLSAETVHAILSGQKKPPEIAWHATPGGVRRDGRAAGELDVDGSARNRETPQAKTAQGWADENCIIGLRVYVNLNFFMSRLGGSSGASSSRPRGGGGKGDLQ